MENTIDFEFRMKIFKALNESQRRWSAARKASESGYGGIKKITDITGLSGTAVTDGIKEPETEKSLNSEKIRKTGGGRKKLRDKDGDIIRRITEILNETAAGDPVSLLKRTCKSARNIAGELKTEGFNISYRTVCRISEDSDCSLQGNRKVISESDEADRDEQFQYINFMVKMFPKEEFPVISADTKKKELTGNFKNNGRIREKKGDARKVNDHDFSSPAEGTAIPYGAYDINRNEGFVNAGITADTSGFAVCSIEQRWKIPGSKYYPDAEKLLICADGGGSNGSRSRVWKYNLQKFSEKTGMAVTVCHCPPGTGKRNKTGHRMFSFISLNRKGRPSESYETAVNLTGGTENRKGLKTEAGLDRNDYRKGIKISDGEFSRINIFFHEKHPKWNYTIEPKILISENKQMSKLFCHNP